MCTGCGAAVIMPLGMRERRTDSSPSLISISARLDSSSRSMSFLILRRSMRSPIPCALCLEPCKRGLECVAVAVGAESGHDADRQVAEVRLAAERFARVRIRQVHLDERDA